MIMRNIAVAVLLLCLYSCQDGQRSAEKSDGEQNSYYKRVPDAPLDLYCLLNSSITEEERNEICRHIMFNLSGNLSAEIIASIHDGQPLELDIQTFFFEDNVPKKDSVLSPIIVRVLHQPGLENLIAFKNSRTGDVVMRLQIERVCAGYVNMNSPAIQDIADSIRSKTR